MLYNDELVLIKKVIYYRIVILLLVCVFEGFAVMK